MTYRENKPVATTIKEGVVQLANDIGGTAENPSVIQISGESGEVLVKAAAIVFDTSLVNPSISQDDKVSGNASDLLISAQNAIGATSNGGNLFLTAGAGTSNNGTIELKSGLNSLASFTADKIDFSFTGQTVKLDSITSNTSVDNNYILNVDTSTLAITITLPSTPNNGDFYIIKDISGNASVNNITVNGNGNIFDFTNNATYTIDGNFTGVGLVFDSVNNKWSTLPYIYPGGSISVPDATTSTKGIIRLAKDLAGTALNPTVVGINGILINPATPLSGDYIYYDGVNFNYQQLPSASASNEGIITLARDLSGTSLLPTVVGLRGININATAPADGQVLVYRTSGNNYIPEIVNPDATTSLKGLIQLANDLSGTAAAPTVVKLTGSSGTTIVSSDLQFSNANHTISVIDAPASQAGVSLSINGQNSSNANSGNINISAGEVISGSGIAGNITIESGDGTGGNRAGNLVLRSGNTENANLGGSVSITSGNNTLSTSSAYSGGPLSLTTGNGFSGGSLNLTTGTGINTATSTGGNINLTTGIGFKSGNIVFNVPANLNTSNDLNPENGGIINFTVNNPNSGNSNLLLDGFALDIKSGLKLSRNRTVSSNSAIFEYDNILSVKTGGGPLTLTLPAAANSTDLLGQTYLIKDVENSAETNSITINCSGSFGATINGSSTLELNVNGACALIVRQSDGLNVSWQAYVFNNGSSATPSGVAGGDLEDTYPNPTVAKLRSKPIDPALAAATLTNGQYLSWSTSNNRFEITNPPSGGSTPDATTTTKGIVQLANDFSGTAIAPEVVALTGATNNINVKASNFTFTNNIVNPLINQEDVGITSTNGQILTIQSQNATGTTSNGGNLVLKTGTGTSSPGDLIFSIGSTQYASFTGNKLNLSNCGIRNNTQTYGISSTLSTSDNIIFADVLSGAVTITLPLIKAAGDEYTIKDTNGNARLNNITVDGNGSNIDGTLTYIIKSNYGAATFVYNGSQWNVI